MPRRPLLQRLAPEPSGSNRAVAAVLAATLLHGLLAAVLSVALPKLRPPPLTKDRPANLMILEPPPEKEEEVPEEPEEERRELPDGQLVEVAPPEEEVKPEEAEYLSEYDISVPEETRSERYEVNPEVLAPQWSKEQAYEQEDIVDVNVTEPSTGATVGNNSFEPDRDGALASLPSPWALTNKEGTQAPVPASHAEARLAGSPQNDRLDERRGDAVALNTKEFLYASYLNRIRRLVNFYWQQNLDNLGPGVSLSKSSYTTAVEAILSSDGALEQIEVTARSGSPELDDCLVRAFRVAGPFPNPPEGLVEKDGRVYLPSFEFTVNIGQAQMRFVGVDPRSSVQFPGILKAPR